MPIDIELLLNAYAHGIFPMADSRDDKEAFWVEPQNRAILPINGFHLSKSLSKTIRQDRFEVTTDRAFASVIELCAEVADDRRETWINSDIEVAFIQLHQMGLAHSVECWSDGRLMGGLYGLALGRAFFGESMFSRASDASKVAMAWLVARMRVGGYALLDCQFMTDHLKSMGAIEISQSAYLEQLEKALSEVRAQVSTVVSLSPPGSASSDGAGAAAGALSAGADWGALDRLLVESSLGSSAGASSPGKLIRHSLTQMS